MNKTPDGRNGVPIYDEAVAKLEAISNGSRVALYMSSVIYIIISIVGMIGYRSSPLNN